MEIGVSTGLFYHRSILEILPLISEAGFRYIEIWAGPIQYGGTSHFDWHKETEVNSLRKALPVFNLTAISLHAPFSEYTDISSPDPVYRNLSIREIERALLVARELNIETVILHPASTPRSKEKFSEHFPAARESLDYLAVIAQNLGIRIAIETQLPHILGGDAETIEKLIGHLPYRNVGICFDTSHVNLWPTGLRENFRRLSARIIALHISDNNGQFDDHLIPGEGKINWTEFVHDLRQSQNNSNFMLEVLGTARQKDPHYILKTSFQQAKKYLNGFGG